MDANRLGPEWRNRLREDIADGLRPSGAEGLAMLDEIERLEDRLSKPKEDPTARPSSLVYRLDNLGDRWTLEGRDRDGRLWFGFNGPLDACLSWIARMEDER